MKVADFLTKEETDSIKMMAIRLFGHISQRNYERLRHSFKEKIHLLTLQTLGTRVAKLSGVSPVTLECCIGICHAFTGTKAKLDRCSTCGEPRYDKKGRPRQKFEYLPFTERLQALFNSPELVKKLSYRKDYVQHAGALDDIFDSSLYKNLCARNIVIDGVDTGTRYFSGDYDIATALLTDGVHIFEKGSQQNSSCWPLMLQNLSLSPSDRAQLGNLIPLGVIPGPNQPKDFDSFLVPFVDDCIALARGVRTVNVLTGKAFTLRHHPLLVDGDMQAIKHLEQMKGPGAKVPCPGCETVGIYHAAKKTYYLPLTSPTDMPSPLPGDKPYDPLNLNLRTERRIAQPVEKIEGARNKTQREDLTKKYGVSGSSILDRIPSISRPDSYPHEFMHLFLLNHGPELVSLWTNSCYGITDSGSENYLISPADWIQIGLETENATRLIPSAFIRPLPNIKTGQSLHIAESWSFWFIHIAPVVLRGRLAKKYYDHFLELVNILRCLLELTNTVTRIKQLRKEIAGYVKRFEE